MKVEEYGLQEDFILLWANKIPYQYIRKADIYVRSSRHGGYCITLVEAKCFKMPIISINFVGTREQLERIGSSYISDFDSIELFKLIKIKL